MRQGPVVDAAPVGAIGMRRNGAAAVRMNGASPCLFRPHFQMKSSKTPE